MKLAPSIVTMVPPSSTPLSGVIRETVGAGSVISNPFVSVPVPVSGFVMTTFQSPMVAPSISKLLHVNCIELSNANVVQSMSDSPAMVSFIVAPSTKFDPSIVTPDNV